VFVVRVRLITSTKNEHDFHEAIERNEAESFLADCEEEMHMLAKDIMTRDIIMVKPQMTVKQLALLLIKNQISGAPVAAEDGKIVGVVSEADILAKKARQVKGIMSTKVVSVNEDTPVEEIAQIMATRKIKRLPVMKGNKIVGIVSRADIVSAIALGKHVAVHTPVYDL
jgi:CBS domain-containing protein